MSGAAESNVSIVGAVYDRAFVAFECCKRAVIDRTYSSSSTGMRMLNNYGSL